MAEWETRSGPVTDLQFPKPGVAKVKIGGRTVKVFTKAYQSDEPAEVWTYIEKCFNDGAVATVRGTIYEGTGSDNKPYKSFDAKAIGNEQDAASANGSKAPSSGGASDTLLRANLEATSLLVALSLKALGKTTADLEDGELKTEAAIVRGWAEDRAKESA